MYLRRLYDDDLAQASYLIGCQQQGTAIVIDPVRDVSRYLDLARHEGLRITAVAETHIHADYLSGARELAAASRASLYLSDEGTPEWRYAYPHTSVRHGTTITLGNITLRALHTPGHTPEHISFLVTDGARSPEPALILTGDFVFVGDIGRPDLLDEVAGAENTRLVGARQLFRSLHDLLLTLPDYVQIWPGHGAGSACGKALGAMESSTVGYERRYSWWGPLVSRGDEEAFTRELLNGQPDAPAYFGRMKRENRDGPALIGEARDLPAMSMHDLERALDAGARLIDTRPREAYQEAALPGSVHLPAGRTFETWAGWLLDPARPYVLFARNHQQAETLRRRLWMVGVDRVIGYVGTFEGLRLTPQPPLPAARAAEYPHALVLDVRSRSEHDGGSIPGARHLHAGRIMQELGDLPRDTPIIVHCQGGARSAVVASVLRAEGLGNVLDLEGGYAAWTAEPGRS